MVLVSVSGYSQKADSLQQKKIQDFNINFPKAKPKFIVSGVTFIAGALVNVVRTYRVEPEASKFVDINDYNRAMKSYNQSQKDLHRISSFFYGLGGLALISISFDF